MVEWYKKFKVGQKVRVVTKIAFWVYNGHTTSWGGNDMNTTIGKIYMIKSINKFIGYELGTAGDCSFIYNYWYPVEALELARVKGKQLLFKFMMQ